MSRVKGTETAAVPVAAAETVAEAVSVWFSVAVAVAFLLPVSAFPALSAADIMKRNEETKRLRDEVADAAIDTKGSDGVSHLKKFTWWRKLEGDSLHYNTITRFLEPAEVRGEAILFLEHGSDENEVMLYLPAFKKVRRVESQSQSGSFMGSAFSYSDIATPHVDDYKDTLLREEACPDSGGKCWVVESKPVSDSVRDRTGAARTVAWIRQDSFMDVKGESYDSEGNLFKQFSAQDLHEVDPAAHKWMAYRIEIKNLRSSNATTLIFSNVKVNQNLSDALFTQANLMRER